MPRAEEYPVIGWHMLSGPMLIREPEEKKRRFVTHWTRVPEDGWVMVDERLPEREDADIYRTVLAEDVFDGVKIIGYGNLLGHGHFVRWRRMPEPPETMRREGNE